MKAKDLILVALICANVTLGALALGLHMGKVEPAAHAATQTRAGDYVIVTGPVTSSREAMLVIDVVAKRANLYVPAAATTATGVGWELTDTHNLVADFGVGG
jgi:hypothetical protein